MANIFLESFIHTGQREIIHDIEKKIGENSAWVLDHRMLSHDSVTLTIEIKVSRLIGLAKDLQFIGIQLDMGKMNNQLERLNTDSDRDEKVFFYFVINLEREFVDEQIEVQTI